MGQQLPVSKRKGLLARHLGWMANTGVNGKPGWVNRKRIDFLMFFLRH